MFYTIFIIPIHNSAIYYFASIARPIRTIINKLYTEITRRYTDLIFKPWLFRLIAFTFSLSMTNAPDDFYIRLRREIARASFVERVNIPRISFRIESFQVIAIQARRKAPCVFRSAMRATHIWPRVCVRGRGMHASCVYVCCVHIYLYIGPWMERELEREHMRPGPQLNMPRANIYAVAINQFDCLW